MFSCGIVVCEGRCDLVLEGSEIELLAVFYSDEHVPFPSLGIPRDALVLAT
jgi:hypothetical protein